MGFETLVFLLAVLPRRRNFLPSHLEDQWIQVSGFPTLALLFEALDEFIVNGGTGIHKPKAQHLHGFYRWDDRFHQIALRRLKSKTELFAFYTGLSGLEKTIFFHCRVANTGEQGRLRFFLSQYKQEELMKAEEITRRELSEAVEDLFEKAQDANILHLLGENNYIATNQLWLIRSKDYFPLLLLHAAERRGWIRLYRDRSRRLYYDISDEPHVRHGHREIW